MKFIGITGSYSSGKSFILRYLQNNGCKVFSADEFIRVIYQKETIQENVMDILPELKIFDKAAIASIIYNDDNARKKLEDFLHPKVAEALLLFKQENVKEEIIFAEIPLLFEAGFEKYFDLIVTAYCNEDTRYTRAKARGGLSIEKFNILSAIQLSQELKIFKSDIAINTGSDKLMNVLAQVLASLA